MSRQLAPGWSNSGAQWQPMHSLRVRMHAQHPHCTSPPNRLTDTLLFLLTASLLIFCAPVIVRPPPGFCETPVPQRAGNSTAAARLCPTQGLLYRNTCL